MATVLTVNFAWVLPVPGSEIDLWGQILNDTFGAVGGNTPLDNIDTDLWAVKTTADGALQRAGGTMTGALTLNGAVPTGNEAVGFTYLDANYASAADIAGLAPLASPVFTGNPTGPTPAPGDNDFSLATTAFVAAANALLAPLASPLFTGDPRAPTPAVGDGDTTIATTAFVQDAVKNIPVVDVASGRSLALSDAGKLLVLAAATSLTLTVPDNATVAFPLGTRIDLTGISTGPWIISPAGGVTIRSAGNKLQLNVIYSGATLWKRATNEWFLFGDIKA